MDSLFGIGLPELFLIAVIALIVLGPQRLPGTIREVAKFIRQVRNLTNEFTAQFGDDFKALDELNPRKIITNMIAEEDEKEAKAKEVATKPTTAKPTPAKPTSPASTTIANKTVSNAAKALAAVNATTPSTPPAGADNAINSAVVTSPETTTATNLVIASTVAAEKVDTKVEAVKIETIVVAEAVAGDENRIMPPTGKEAAKPTQLNGHTETSPAFLAESALVAEPLAQAVPETKVEAIESVQ